jgi:hypothetical protein
METCEACKDVSERQRVATTLVSMWSSVAAAL